MIFANILFWCALIALLWTFIGYPLVVILCSKLFPTPWKRGRFNESVSMIIAAHNEEKVIREKVENCLQLDFGTGRTEIYIISDGSRDRTNGILAEYNNTSKHLKIITYSPRMGKANAINIGVDQTCGDVLIFSDANVMIDKKSCQFLLAPFADPEVGAVCGKVLVKGLGDDEIAGESLYMKYESAIQHGEALLWSMVGVDGAFYAIRSDFFKRLPLETILDDFTISMHVPSHKMRIVYEPLARGVEVVKASAANEFKRKKRIVSGGYQFLAYILKNKMSFSFRMWCAFLSHKIFHWIAPFFLMVAFLSNIILALEPIYFFIFLGQIFFYLLACIGFFIKKMRSYYVIYLPYYFCIVNVAAFLGFFEFITLRQKTLWEKVTR